MNTVIVLITTITITPISIVAELLSQTEGAPSMPSFAQKEG